MLDRLVEDPASFCIWEQEPHTQWHLFNERSLNLFVLISPSYS